MNAKNHRFVRIRTRTEPAILVTVTSAILGVGCQTHGHIVSSIIVRLLACTQSVDNLFHTLIVLWEN